jgi:predicted MFS family arabinose efflux permease
LDPVVDRVRQPGAPTESGASAGAAAPSPRSLRGLDGVNFFIGNIQTGFGPFIAVYLTARGWTQLDIGSILSIGGLAALASQLPGGALVDAVREKRGIAMAAVLAITMSALFIAALPSYPLVLLAEILHGIASSLLGPAIAAISLGLVGHRLIARRFARNARFASIGNGIAAAAMGACGFYVSDRAVFLLTAALGIPALIALRAIRPSEIDPDRASGAIPENPSPRTERPGRLLRNRGLMIFAACSALFQLANAAMLPLLGGILTARSSHWAIVLIAASLVLPQIVVALLAPLVGSSAETWGRKPLLLIGFGTLPIRGVLFALVHSPYLLAAAQLLDGISAAVFSVMSTLVIADLTRGTGRFNLAQGVVGVAIGIGASLSPTIGGFVADRFGNEAAFLCLTAAALAAVAIVYAWMPETRPPDGR